MPSDARARESLAHGDILVWSATGLKDRPFDVPLDRLAGPYLEHLTADELPSNDDMDRAQARRSVLDECRGGGM